MNTYTNVYILIENDTNAIYRLRDPTEIQLTLLDNGPGEQSLTSSLMISGNNRLTQNENEDEQQQQLLCQLHSNEYKSTYDIIGNGFHLNTSSSSSYPHVQDSGYETTSLNIDYVETFL